MAKRPDNRKAPNRPATVEAVASPTVEAAPPDAVIQAEPDTAGRAADLTDAWLRERALQHALEARARTWREARGLRPDEVSSRPWDGQPADPMRSDAPAPPPRDGRSFWRRLNEDLLDAVRRPLGIETYEERIAREERRIEAEATAGRRMGDVPGLAERSSFRTRAREAVDAADRLIEETRARQAAERERLRAIREGR